MSTNNNEQKPPKIAAVRRSSLKSSDLNAKLDPESLLKIKNKRNSVSWGQSNTFQFKAMKAMFQESKEIDKPSKETFVESRKKSIKDEFSIVKEMMKNKNIIEEEDDLDDEVKKNTNKNVQIGHDALNEEESESNSNTHSDNSDHSDNEDNENKN